MEFKMNYVFAVLMLLLAVGPAMAADTDFRIEINDLLSDNADKQGGSVQVSLGVENVGADGTQYVECGIYTKAQVESWGYNTRQYFAIFSWWRDIDNVENCKSSESNVDTVKITLDRGEKVPSDSLFMVMKAPYTNPNDEYVIFCDAYKACYGAPGFQDIDNRVTGVDISKFDLQESGYTSTETCSDGIMNQDESDTDCGGKCQDCPEYYKCKKDSDCLSGFCEGGVCGKSQASGGSSGGSVGGQDTCHDYWWYDDDSQICQEDEFCVIDWHDGLRMFNSESQCNLSLEDVDSGSWLKEHLMWLAAGGFAVMAFIILLIGLFMAKK
jgi:hypothetical protein